MEKDIGKIPKNDTTEIVLRIDDFADKRGFTIREFVTSDRYTGFTKSGVRILAKDWQKFKEMINSVNDEDMKETLPEDQKTLDEAAMADAQAEEQKAEESETKTPSKEELPDY
jgi:hypothetical protein